MSDYMEKIRAEENSCAALVADLKVGDVVHWTYSQSYPIYKAWDCAALVVRTEDDHISLQSWDDLKVTRVSRANYSGTIKKKDAEWAKDWVANRILVKEEERLDIEKERLRLNKEERDIDTYIKRLEEINASQEILP